MKKRILIGLVLSLSFFTVNCAKDMSCSYTSAGLDLCFEKAQVDFVSQVTFSTRCGSLSGTETDGLCPAGEIGQCTTNTVPGVTDVTVKGYNMLSGVWNTFASTCAVF